MLIVWPVELKFEQSDQPFLVPSMVKSDAGQLFTLFLLQDLVEGGGYQAHILTVQYFTDGYPEEKRADAKIFDAGAGTGMVARGVSIRFSTFRVS